MILTLVSSYPSFILFLSTPSILAYSINSDSFIYPTFFTSTPLLTSTLRLCYCQHNCHALIIQVYAMLAESARRMPSWDPAVHSLCMHHAVVPTGQTRTASGAVHAVVTAATVDLREAVTLREVARQIVVDVPLDIDPRGRRFASTWWMQPRGPGAAETTWVAA